jgi:hypothetical protein
MPPGQLSIMPVGTPSQTPQQGNGITPVNNTIPMFGGTVAHGGMTLQQLEQALANGTIDYNTYQQAYNQLASNGTPNAQQSTALGVGGMDLQNFINTVQTLTGQAPTTQQISSWFTQVPGTLAATPGMSTNMNDVTAANNAYIQNAFGPQIQQNQQQNQQNSLNTALSGATGIVNSQIQNAQNALLNPQNIQNISGSLNNSGMLNSGAFSSTLANDLAQSAQGDISSLLGGVAAPALSSQVNTANAPYEGFLSNLYPGLNTVGNTQQATTNFNQLQQLMQSLGLGGAGTGANGSAGGAGGSQNLSSLMQALGPLLQSGDLGSLFGG